MKTFVMWECVVILVFFLIRLLYKIYKRHKDKNKIKDVLRYLGQRTDNIDIKKLQKMLGVDDDEDKT